MFGPHTVMFGYVAAAEMVKNRFNHPIEMKMIFTMMSLRWNSKRSANITPSLAARLIQNPV